MSLDEPESLKGRREDTKGANDKMPLTFQNDFYLH